MLIGTPKYIKQILKDLREIESNTIVVEVLSTDRSLRQKINKETLKKKIRRGGGRRWRKSKTRRSPSFPQIQ